MLTFAFKLELVESKEVKSLPRVTDQLMAGGDTCICTSSRDHGQVIFSGLPFAVNLILKVYNKRHVNENWQTVEMISKQKFPLDQTAS